MLFIVLRAKYRSKWTWPNVASRACSGKEYYYYEDGMKVESGMGARATSPHGSSSHALTCAGGGSDPHNPLEASAYIYCIFHTTTHLLPLSIPTIHAGASTSRPCTCLLPADSRPRPPTAILRLIRNTHNEARVFTSPACPPGDTDPPP